MPYSSIVTYLVLTTFFLSDRCSMPLGVEDGRIRDSDITSRIHTRYGGYDPWRGRLNSATSWYPRSRTRSFLQINFQTFARVRGVATQGRGNANQYVRTYSISTSKDGMRFAMYRENRRLKVCTYQHFCEQEVLKCIMLIFVQKIFCLTIS